MSTAVRTEGGSVVALTLKTDATVGVTISYPDGTYPVHRIVSRADFLAAVAKECNVVVIDRADFPDITGTIDALIAGEGTNDPHVIRVNVLCSLALAEYLDAHPPVDEADVEALTTAMQEVVRSGPMGAEHLARRLLATGRIEVKRP